MRKTLYAPELLFAIGQLDHAIQWLEAVRRDTDVSQTFRLEWIDSDIRRVRSLLLGASVADVEVAA